MRSFKPLVVVQNNLVTRLTEPASLAARELGITVHDLSAGESFRTLPEADNYWSPILVLGSVLFVDTWSRCGPGLTHWFFWDSTNFDTMIWKNQLGDEYLNADGFSMLVGEFQNSKLGEHHIRPRVGLKLVGDVLQTESSTGRESLPGLMTTPHHLKSLNIDPNRIIWASPLKHIDVEIRVWMIGGKAVCASTYRVHGKAVEETESDYVKLALLKAEEYHEIWNPSKHYVVDIALVGSGVKVIEYNSIHSSGWYAVDPKDVISAYIKAESA